MKRINRAERQRRLAAGIAPKSHRSSHSLMIWVDPKLRESIEDLAAWEDVSVSQFCREVLEQFVSPQRKVQTI